MDTDTQKGTTMNTDSHFFAVSSADHAVRMAYVATREAAAVLAAARVTARRAHAAHAKHVAQVTA